MLTEDHVSFEVAKLLKEKGFNEYTATVYNQNGSFMPNGAIEDTYQTFYSAPTLQMAMKWLREVHNIFIEISVDEILKDEGYQWALYYNSTKEIRPYSGWGDSYEEACEAAIQYVLKNLI